MNSGVTAERVYDALKRRILNRAFRPGDRLEPVALADSLGSSATPVRDALHLLTGEGLLETRSGSGFHLALIDEPALEDLYGWAAQVLLLAVRDPPERQTEANAKKDTNAGAATSTAALFERIAGGSDNIEHRREIRSINDRLHATRLAEAALFADWRDELARIEAAWTRNDLPALRRLIQSYHRRRHRAAARLVRALYRLDFDG